MNTQGVKSYSSCYLYNKIPDYERAIMQFVMKSERINKQSESFSGVIEDVKRRQSTAVISRVLMREDVVLCINNRPLPAAFKVFICNDVKSDRTPKVFIDCTGLIDIKNGYFVVNKIDILSTYLLAAMDCLVYQYDEKRIVSNSSIIQAGTECFVSLASHVFDYFRPNGFAENRNKIAYILGMYFQVSILGLEHDQSTCGLAARVAGMKSSDIKALELYYADEDLTNIDTLVTSIANTFKMTGMGTDVFVEKWTWFYGVGTQFAMELFSAFAVMITNAYCGSYVNNQKSIEKCCGRSMVNFSTAMIRVGAESIDRGFRYESANVREDLEAKKAAKDKPVKKKEKMLDRLKKAKKVSESYILNSDSEYNNLISNTIRSSIRESGVRDKRECVRELQESITNLTMMLNEKDSRIKSKDNTIGVLEDCKVALKMLDPENPVVTESNHYNFNKPEEMEYTRTSKAIEEGVFGPVLQEAFDDVVLNEVSFRTPDKWQKKYKLPRELCFNTSDLYDLKPNQLKELLDASISYVQNDKDRSHYAYSILVSVMNMGNTFTIKKIKEDKVTSVVYDVARKYMNAKEQKQLSNVIKMNGRYEDVNVNYTYGITYNI